MEMRLPASSTLNKADHTVFGLKQARDAGQVNLRSYSGTGGIKIEWGMNQACEDDAVFRLTLEGNSVLLSKEEMLRAIRYV